MPQDTMSMSYHDRVEALFLNVQKLFNDMKEFSNNIQKGATETMAPKVTATVKEPEVTAAPIKEPVETSTSQSTNPAQLVAGIDLDALLNGSDLQL